MQRHLNLHSASGEISIYHTSSGAAAMGTLVCIHGGPNGDHHGNNGIFDELADLCVPVGYDVLQFDMFGAGTSEGSQADITLTTQLQDYAAALEFARRELPKPLHVIGESMGATIAALAWQPDVATYILLWPAFDLRDTDLRPYFAEPWTAALHSQGFLNDNGVIVGRQFVEQTLAQDFDGCFRLPAVPCLLVHGKGDTAVPFQQSIRALSQASGPCALFAHPTGDHGLQKQDERRFTHDAVTSWLAR